MVQFSIRYANQEDIPSIAEFQQKMAKETEALNLDSATVLKGVEAIFADPLKGFYIVGERTNGISQVGEQMKDQTTQICSCLMITPEWSDWRNNYVWWIQSVYVLPECRGSGVFRMMYTFIKSLVSERHDVAGIRLYVDNTNLLARDVYKRIGMTDEHYRLFEWMKG